MANNTKHNSKTRNLDLTFHSAIDIQEGLAQNIELLFDRYMVNNNFKLTKHVRERLTERGSPVAKMKVRDMFLGATLLGVYKKNKINKVYCLFINKDIKLPDNCYPAALIAFPDEEKGEKGVQFITFYIENQAKTIGRLKYSTKTTL